MKFAEVQTKAGNIFRGILISTSGGVTINQGTEIAKNIVFVPNFRIENLDVREV